LLGVAGATVGAGATAEGTRGLTKKASPAATASKMSVGVGGIGMMAWSEKKNVGGGGSCSMPLTVAAFTEAAAIANAVTSAAKLAEWYVAFRRTTDSFDEEPLTSAINSTETPLPLKP